MTGYLCGRGDKGKTRIRLENIRFGASSFESERERGEKKVSQTGEGLILRVVWGDGAQDSGPFDRLLQAR